MVNCNKYDNSKSNIEHFELTAKATIGLIVGGSVISVILLIIFLKVFMT